MAQLMFLMKLNVLGKDQLTILMTEICIDGMKQRIKMIIQKAGFS